MGNIQKIKPSGIFTNYIFKSIPLAFDESLSYYEMLCGILDLLKTQEEIVNNNADLLAELESYVKNYFDNLNVQEEINNKLDEMAEDGTLENLISEYIELMTTYTYNNVAEMKQATNLVNGSFARTSGFSSYNDGGGAYYKIRQVINTDVIDEMFIIALNDNNLVAELMYNDLNIKQIGAKGNNQNDDSNIVQYAINKLASTGGNLVFPKSIYLFENGITIPVNNELINIIGNNSTFIFTNSTGNAFTCMATGDDVCRITFNDLRILYEGTGEDIIGIKIQKVTDRKIINNVKIRGFYDNIWVKNSWYLIFDKLASTEATHDGFFCEDIVNAFNFNSCIFQNNARFNFLLTGRAHVLNNCDFSIYNNTSQNKFYGIDGVSLNGCYYEESNDPAICFVFQACYGVSINGCYFDITSTNSSYKLFDINGSKGLAINECSFKSNSVVQNDNSYIIYMREGSSVNIKCNRFMNLKKVCYLTNTQLSLDNNTLTTITSFITQDNHTYARIVGNLQYASEYTGCTLPHKEIVRLEINNIATYGNTSDRPNGYYTGQTYYNTQTNHLDIYNGSTWQTS